MTIREHQGRVGRPASGQYGVAAPPPRQQSGGVPAGAMGIGPKPKKPELCGLPTKAGTACKARPVRGSAHCWFHNRQAEALAREVEAA